MKTKLDHKKLLALINEAIEETDGGVCCATSFAIGEIGGVQIVVKVTREEDDFHSMHAETKCLTKA